MRKDTIIILFIVFILLLLTFFNYGITKKNIDYYVITMGKDERLRNIKKQELKMNLNSQKPIKIELVDAVIGKNLNIQQLYKDKTVTKNNIQRNEYHSWSKYEDVEKREIGCYFSHLKIYKNILRKNKEGYSVIFEDDFLIKINNFVDYLDNILQHLDYVDFDILYLGNKSHNHGNWIISDVYQAKKDTIYGTHAMLINNKNISKILEATKMIDMPIDDKYTEIIINDKLNVLVVYPNIVDPDEKNLQSEINVVNDENY